MTFGFLPVLQHGDSDRACRTGAEDNSGSRCEISATTEVPTFAATVTAPSFDTVWTTRASCRPNRGTITSFRAHRPTGPNHLSPLRVDEYQVFDLRPGVHAELAQDAGHMGLDSATGQQEPPRDVGVRLPLGDHTRHTELGW